MFAYLYGPDTYRRGRYLREQLLAPYHKKYPDGSVGVFDLLEEDAVAKLQSFSGGTGLFAKTALAVVYHPEEGEKEFVKFLKEVGESTATTVIVVADKKLTKEFAFLMNGKEKEFEPLSGLDFLKFIKAEAKTLELAVTDVQLKAIGEAYDGDTWAAMTEIERVAAGGAIEQHTIVVDFMGLLRTLSAGRNLPALLRALTLLTDYDEPAKVFNLLGAFVYGSAKIKMADYDLAVKTGKLEYPEVLLDFVLGASS